MPRLIAFIVCQKAIVNKDNGLISLVEILNGFSVEQKPGADAADGALNFEWAAVSFWYKDDEGTKPLRQRVQIVRPDGKTVGDAELDVDLSEDNANVVLRGQVLPISGSGVYKFRLSSRVSENDSEWRIESEYPLEIVVNEPDVTV